MHTSPRRLTRSLTVIVGLVAATMLIAGCTAPTEEQSTLPPIVSPSVAPSESAPPSVEPAPEEGGAAAARTVTRGAEIRITDAAGSAVHCDGGGEVDVEFAGTVTITGNCDDIDIEVGGVTATIERTSNLDIDRTGSTVEAAEIGELDIEGDDNTVTVGQVREIDIEGVGNTVRYSGAAPDVVVVEGHDNTVERG